LEAAGQGKEHNRESLDGLLALDARHVCALRRGRKGREDDCHLDEACKQSGADVSRRFPAEEKS